MFGFEQRLNALWYSQRPVPWILRALAKFYGWVLLRRKSIATEALPVPVLVVGNFTVGGTGKTPLIIAIVNHMQSAGIRVGVVSRGYGRKTQGARSVELQSLADEVGDEPLLIARRTSAPVRVDANRLAAAAHLINRSCQIIISDDGLQHRRLPRQLELEVIDALRGYGNGQLLPAGPLREIPRNVDARVCNGARNDVETTFAMHLKLLQAINIKTGESRPLSSFRGHAFTALAGIGNPERFFMALSECGLSFQTKAYPDHYPYRAEDIPAGLVLMTEKDAVKCTEFATAQHWRVPVEAQLSSAFFQWLMAKLDDLGVPHA